MADFRITDLQVQTQLTEDSWVATDNTNTGYRRFNLKSVSDAASAANTAATAAMAAKTAADAAKASADAAAADAAEAATSAESRIDAAIDAIGDISELAVPLMSSDTRGGAKLGHGLKVSDGSLHVGALAETSTGAVLGPLASVDAKGWAEQFTTTGKNLLHLTAESKSGITATTGADGSMTFSGTATTDYLLIANFTLSAGTYSLSGCPSGGTSTTYRLDAFSGSYTAGGFKGNDYGSGFTFTHDGGGVWIRLVINLNATVNNLTFYPQLELGSTATAYEPYTGGAPSPSPSYPQEIRVGKGRNLLNYPPFVNTGSSRSKIVKVREFTLEAGTYTISRDYADSECQANLYDLNDSLMANVPPGMKSKSFVVASDTTFKGIECDVPANSERNIQLERSSTPSPYVPYGYVGLEARIDPNIILDGYGLDGDAVAISTEYYTVQTVQLSELTEYEIIISRSGTGWVIVFAMNANEQVISTLLTDKTTGTTTNRYTINTPIGTTHLKISCPYIASFEVISTTPIPLPSTGYAASLPDGTADELTIDPAGKVQWVQRVGKVVFDGSNDENWGFDSTNTRAYVLVPNVSGRIDLDVTARALSDRYRLLGYGQTTASGRLGFVITAGQYMYVRDEDNCTSKTDFTTWLSTHPVTVYYPLATPVTHNLGYVDLPDIPGEATVSIKELSNLQLTFWVDSDGSLHAASKAWYERARSEYEDRLTSLEEAVATLVTGT